MADDYFDNYKSYDPARPDSLTWTRVVVGGVARLVTWLCILFIVGNAVVQALIDGYWLLALIEVVVLPLTFVVYPFAAPADALAWPLADGTTFIPFLVVALVAYPISTFVGGFEPIEWGGR